MSTNDDDGGIGAEVSSRLDELFGDEDSPETSADSPGKSAADMKKPPKQRPAVASEAEFSDEDSPISNLKALVFGIDWEITDESMVAFLQEVRRLQKQYQNDKILSMFLKLHESIGKYIKSRKARAHPDAIKFVTSVFKNFEKVLLTPGMSENQKKRLLSEEVKKFKAFKQRVISREKAMGPEIAAAPEAEVKPGAKPAPSAVLDNQEALDYIVEELKKTIKAEFHTIRQIIKNLGA